MGKDGEWKSRVGRLSATVAAQIRSWIQLGSIGFDLIAIFADGTFRNDSGFEINSINSRSRAGNVS